MPWIKPRVMERRPGVEGREVWLIDVSGSMAKHRATVALEMNARAKRVKNFRLFAFAEKVKELAPSNFANEGGGLGEGTNMLPGIRAIAKKNQGMTIIMSDGETVDGAGILACISRMAGTIHCLYCGSDSELKRALNGEQRILSVGPESPNYFTGPSLMIELARIGGGQCVPIDHRLDPDSFREALQKTFQPATSHGGNMKRYPDYHVQGDQIDFRQPPRRRIDMTQHVDVHHQTVFNHIHHAPQQIEHGEPGQQNVYISGAQINMHQLPDQRQQVADRGHVVEVRHQHAALPKPGIRMPGARQLALPAPERAHSSNSRPLGLPAPEQPMQRVSARQLVLAAFNQAAKR